MKSSPHTQLNNALFKREKEIKGVKYTQKGDWGVKKNESWKIFLVLQTKMYTFLFCDA